MKITYAIVLAAQALSAFSSPSPAAPTPETDCGPLGVMDITKLPEGVDLTAVRKCLEHPLSLTNNTSLTSEPELGLIEKRDCWHGKPFGCTDGFCWKSCGDGPWCFTAHNDGFGDWYTCNSDADCRESYPCSQKSGGDCASCGCSC